MESVFSPFAVFSRRLSLRNIQSSKYMSTANHTARASSPAGAPVPFAEEDLSRIFDQKTLQRGRSLVLLGGVRLGAAEDRIRATVTDLGRTHEVSVTPVHRAQRVALDRTCTCSRPACAHMAAAALLALDTRPQWRRAVQTSMIDLLKTKPGEVMKSAAPKPAAAPVLEIGKENTIRVTVDDIVTGPAISGTLAPKDQATVRAEIGGALLVVTAEQGQAVRKGQLLAQIEARTAAEAVGSAAPPPTR